MPRLAQQFTLLCSLLTFAAVAHAKDGGHAKDRAFITKAVRDMDTAANNRDADGYVRYTADDFVNINEAGKETTHGKAERRQKMIDMFDRGVNVSGHATIVSIIFSKMGATVSKMGATVTETGTTTFKFVRAGQSISRTTHGTWRDFWVKSGGGWLEKRSRLLWVRSAEDDKAF